MTEQTANLSPATPEELSQSLAFALRFKGRKAYPHAADPISRITADHLVEHLRLSGFVVMKKPPLKSHYADDQKLDGYKKHLTE